MITASTTSLMVCSCSARTAFRSASETPDGGEPALLRDQPGQRRAGRRPPAPQRVPGQLAQRAADPADRLPDRHRDAQRAGQRAAQVLDRQRRVLSALPQRPDQQLHRRRLRQRMPAVGVAAARRRRAARSTASSSTWPMSTVSMPSTRLRCDLADQREPVVRQPLDQVHLPQRPRAVQPPGQHPPDELPELFRRSRPRQRRAPHVEGEVEVLVVDPDRPGQPGRHAADPLPIARHEGDPFPDQARSAARSRSRPARRRRCPRCRRGPACARCPEPATTPRAGSGAAAWTVLSLHRGAGAFTVLPPRAPRPSRSRTAPGTLADRASVVHVRVWGSRPRRGRAQKMIERCGSRSLTRPQAALVPSSGVAGSPPARSPRCTGAAEVPPRRRTSAPARPRPAQSASRPAHRPTPSQTPARPARAERRADRRADHRHHHRRTARSIPTARRSTSPSAEGRS